jgi:hypothetical protein
MMWAGVTIDLITGPYFFDVSVTGGCYLELLFHWLIPEPDNTGLLNSAILQQDGAPAHYADDVCAFLYIQFLQWIERHEHLI